MPNEEDAPEDAKKREAKHHVKHPAGIESVRRREIGVNGEGGAIEENEEYGATEPAHLRAEKARRFLAMFGRKPIRFVGKVDPLRRLVGENSGSDKRDESRYAKNHEHKSEKPLFWLKAIGRAVSGEMRSHRVGKLRVNIGPLKKAECQQDEENEPGKTRVVHVGPLRLRVSRKGRSGNDSNERCAQEALAFPEPIAEIGRNPGQTKVKM